MANPSKAKGTAWESMLVKWLRENGFPDADRSPLRGSLDQEQHPIGVADTGD